MVCGGSNGGGGEKSCSMAVVMVERGFGWW